MQKLFITSSGTGIGKTLVTCALAWQLRQKGRKTCALKPVISGYDPSDMGSDAAQIVSACGQEATVGAMEAISPWRYKAPLAPNMAAAQEGMPVDMKALADFCTLHASKGYDALLVEGVGGIMAPVTDEQTVLDWMCALGWPVVLVVGSYLGSISHTLTAIEVLTAYGLPIRGIVLSESEGSGVKLADTRSTLEKFLPEAIPFLTIPRQNPSDRPWEAVPPLDRLYEL